MRLIKGKNGTFVAIKKFTVNDIRQILCNKSLANEYNNWLSKKKKFDEYFEIILQTIEKENGTQYFKIRLSESKQLFFMVYFEPYKTNRVSCGPNLLCRLTIYKPEGIELFIERMNTAE